MTIYKNKKHPGIFRKYENRGRCRWTMYENIFTEETIGNPPKMQRKLVDRLLTTRGKWKDSDFYPVSIR